MFDLTTLFSQLVEKTHMKDQYVANGFPTLGTDFLSACGMIA
jgi:hypothetical protein